MKISAHMRVRLEIEVPLDGSFGEGWTVGKMHEDAVRQVESGIASKVRQFGGKIIGDPQVIHVLVNTDR